MKRPLKHSSARWECRCWKQIQIGLSYTDLSAMLWKSKHVSGVSRTRSYEPAPRNNRTRVAFSQYKQWNGCEAQREAIVWPSTAPSKRKATREACAPVENSNLCMPSATIWDRKKHSGLKYCVETDLKLQAAAGRPCEHSVKSLLTSFPGNNGSFKDRQVYGRWQIWPQCSAGDYSDPRF